MRCANRVAGPPFVERQVQTDEAERRPDGRNLFTGMLRAVGIQRELMKLSELREMCQLVAHYVHAQVPARG